MRIKKTLPTGALVHFDERRSLAFLSPPSLPPPPLPLSPPSTRSCCSRSRRRLRLWAAVRTRWRRARANARSHRQSPPPSPPRESSTRAMSAVSSAETAASPSGASDGAATNWTRLSCSWLDEVQYIQVSRRAFQRQFESQTRQNTCKRKTFSRQVCICRLIFL